MNFRCICFDFFPRKAIMKVYHIIFIIVIVVLVFVIWHNREKWKSMFKVDGGGPIGYNTNYTPCVVKIGSPLNRNGPNDIRTYYYYYEYSTYIFIADRLLYIKAGGSGDFRNSHCLYKEINLHNHLVDQNPPYQNQSNYDIDGLLSRTLHYNFTYLNNITTIFDPDPGNNVNIFRTDPNGHTHILKFVDPNNFYTGYFILTDDINRSNDLCLKLNNLERNVTNTIARQNNVLPFSDAKIVKYHYTGIRQQISPTGENFYIVNPPGTDYATNTTTFYTNNVITLLDTEFNNIVFP